MSPRLVRHGILILLGVVSLVVLWRLRKPPAAEIPQPGVGQETAAADAERGEGVTYSHVQGANERWTLRADQEYREADGHLSVDGNVRFEIGFAAQGENDRLTITAEHGEHDAENAQDPGKMKARFSGKVHVTTGSGLDIKTESLAYEVASGIAETTSPVRFSRKAISGRSRGLRYEGQSERITLPANVELDVRGEGEGSEDVHISARKGTLDRASGVLLLTGDGVIRTASGEITGPRIKATLSPETWRLEQIVVAEGAQLEFQGGAGWTQAAGLGLGPGQYRVVSPRLQVWLSPEGRPQRIVAGPQGALMEWRPPTAGDDRLRSLEAGGIDMNCDALGRIQKVKAHKDVHVRQRGRGPGAAPGPILADATAVDLVAELDPETGGVTKASLLRKVTFTRGIERVRAGWAIFENGVVRLGERPEMVDTAHGSRLTADRMFLGTGEHEGEVEADENVRHTLNPRGAAGGQGLLGSTPVMISSEHATFNFETQAGVYRTATVLRAGENEVKAHALELREKDGKRTLVASDDVVSRWQDANDPEKTTKAVANRMEYDEDKGLLRYQGNVDFSQPTLSIKTAGTVEARLTGGQWTQFEATGDAVDLVLGGRVASGKRLVYSLGTGELTLEGAPAKYQDPSGEVAGRSLTVRTADDTILIDGRSVQRTLMMMRRAPANAPSNGPGVGPGSDAKAGPGKGPGDRAGNATTTESGDGASSEPRGRMRRGSGQP